MDAETRRQIHDGIVALADGDRGAFPRVFAALWPLILSFVLRATRDRADAEDLAQNTLLRVFSRIGEFDPTRDGVAWAFGIAAYEVKTCRRQRERRREAPDAAESLDRTAAADRSQEDEVIQRALLGALTEALGQISDAERTLLLSESPMAEAGVPVPAATIRKRRQRALERLRAAWRTLHG